MSFKRIYDTARVTRKLRRRGADPNVKSESTAKLVTVKSEEKVSEPFNVKKANLAANCHAESESTSNPDEPLIKVEIFEDEVSKTETAEHDLMNTETVKTETIKTESSYAIGESLLKLDHTENEFKLETLVEPQEVLHDNLNFPTNWFPRVLQEDVTASQPKNWDKIYNAIVEMRKLIITPVDSMGCERMPDTITPRMSRDNAKLYRFQLLISLMLSSQTKDEVNFSAMLRLNNHFKDKGFSGLCLEACLSATETELDECIKQVGFHRRKAVYIKKTCEMVQNKFDGDLPKTIEEIISFPGVGPKMGHLLLQNGWGINLGIGIDVHLHRLAQMWGWVPKSEKPEVTRLALEEWLPRKYWADINPLLVGFGQTVCPPRALNCDVCTLASLGLCKGVNRKLAKAEITEARLMKLTKQRGNLLKLVDLRRVG